MKILKTINVMILLAVVITGCSKKEDSLSSNSVLNMSLASDSSTITLGGETYVTATVIGASGNITYSWSVNTSSAIIGSGYKVRLYASCPSCTGPNEITCRAKDETNNSVFKKITVSVKY